MIAVRVLNKQFCVSERKLNSCLFTIGNSSSKCKNMLLVYNAYQKSEVNFQGQNQSSPSPLQNNEGLLSNGLGFSEALPFALLL